MTRLKTPFQTKYHLHDCVLKSVPSAKYLGITISEDLVILFTVIFYDCQSVEKASRYGVPAGSKVYFSVTLILFYVGR